MPMMQTQTKPSTGSRSAKAVCVDPARVVEFWPHARQYIEAAIRRGDNLTDFATVENRVLCGDNLLWVAWDGEVVSAAAVTSLDIANGRKFLTIVACGGPCEGCWP